jgi:hypothetical protein
VIAGLVLVVVAAGAVVAVLRLSSPGHHQASAAAQPPAVTRAEAAQILSHYTTVNNEASQQFSDSLERSVEGGTSYTMDIGSYAAWQLEYPGTKLLPYVPVHPVYYIPDQSAHSAYPHWFVVQATNAEQGTLPHSTPSGTSANGYLLFSQASAGAPWLDVFEPNTVEGGAAAPRIATGAGGYAIAVSPGAAATGLSIAPGQIGSATVTAVDDQGTGAITPPSNLSNLYDEAEKAYFQSYVGKTLAVGTTLTLTHQAGSGPVFGLRTTNGGAIVFYYLSAQLDVVAAPGHTFNLRIPGFASLVSSAEVPYLDQFATYDPPKGQAGAHITADVAGYGAIS